MRRISPRDMVLYLLVILMMLAAVSTLMQMDQAEAPEYSDIRAYFLQRQVESFTLQDNTLTLTLRGEEGPGTGSTITYFRLQYRQYTAAEESYHLLPLAQAVHLAGGYEETVFLTKGYVDRGGETVRAQWLVR